MIKTWLCLTTLMMLGCGAAGGSPDPENPPTTGLEAWLAAGLYKKWKCEPAPRAARSPSPHGQNRICSNAALSAAGAGEYPVDAASVKELFDSTGTTLTGYAVARHVKAGITGDSWYWYEKIGSTVVANGTNVAGCAGCHSRAGSDTAHPGHDFVYIQVR